MPVRTTTRQTAERSTTVSVRLPMPLAQQLNSYTRASGRSRGRSEVIVRAIEHYLSWRLPQQAQVREGIAAAERGELIDHDEVVAWISNERKELRKRIKRHAR